MKLFPLAAILLWLAAAARAQMPAILTVAANGVGQAIVTGSDGRIADKTHPIQPGDAVIILCTGLGEVDAQMNTLDQPTVLIGGVAATLLSAALSQQDASQYQVTVQVSTGTPTGDAVPLQIQMDGMTTPGNVTVAVAGDGPAFQMPHTSCTLSSTDCSQVDLSTTDPFSTAGGFAGYADPTIRQDPITGTLWMAYSWPHTIPSGSPRVAGTQVIDTHLASSTDGGQTWTYKGPLFTSQPVTDPLSGQTDGTSHEVMNLLPQVVNGVTWWYGIHSTYNVPPGSGGGSGLENYSKRWAIAAAPGTADSGPMGLATATPQYLGQDNDTYPQYWPYAVNLSWLDPEVKNCPQFFEPSLVISGNDLLLFLACTPTNAAGRFYAVYKTSAAPENGPNWSWTYVPQGATKFANQKDAVSVGRYLAPGATYITQMDIVPSRNPGIMLAILTAARDTAAGKLSMGCVAAELASVAPPRFAYDAAGEVQVDAYLTSPDSLDGGPGSCTYSPASATGMILAHRQSSKAPQNGGFFTFLMQSLLFP
jgi:hypothetical protein